MSATVRCDKCDKQFSPEVKDVTRRGGGLERSFRCPYCKRKYPVANISVRGVQLMQEVRRVRGELASQPGHERLNEELAGLLKELEPEVTKP